LAQAFDPERLELKGSPITIAEGVTSETMVSAAGNAVTYRTGPHELGQRQLLWVDRFGRETDKVVYPDTAALGPALSPDGRRIAVYKFANGNMDIWTYEVRRRAWDRITFHPGDDIWPVWSPDGASIIFGSERRDHVSENGSVDLYRTVLGAANGDSLLLATPQAKFPLDVSPDGSFLLFEALVPKRGRDLWALALRGDHQPFAVVDTNSRRARAVFSGREMDCVSVQQDGPERNLCSAVSRPGRRRECVDRGWERTLLYRCGRSADGGADSLGARRGA
jgi:hypothetical protein